MLKIYTQITLSKTEIPYLTTTLLEPYYNYILKILRQPIASIWT